MKILAGRKLNLRAQVALVMVALLIIAIAAVTYAAYNALSRKIDHDLEIRTNWSLRVASRVLAESLSVFQVEADADNEPRLLRLYLGADFLKSLSSHELTKIVDGISEANRGTATIFLWEEDKKDFVRMATTVKKPDGSRAVGTVLGQNGAVYPFMMRSEPYRGVAQILGEPYMTGYLPITDDKNKPLGILYIGVGKMAELGAAKIEFLVEAAKIAVIIAVLIGALVFAFVSRVFRPLRQVEAATAQLAAGEVNTDIPHTRRHDDVGNIARAVEGFRDAVRAQKDAELGRVAAAEQIAARKAEMEALVSRFRVSIDGQLVNLRGGNETVVTAVGQIREAISLAAERASDGRRAVIAGEAAVSDVAVATNQYASSIQEISQRANEASTVVRKAAETGHKASAVVGELSEVVDQITNAVGFISSIAAQTNLLALNATIEAARAGEAGRGFAVVASEVKELSNGTAKAAAQIVDLVRGIQTVTTAVTSATADIGNDLESINQTTMAIAAAVAEQEQVTQGIAANASLAANGTGTVRDGFVAIESVIQETSRAADSLDEVSSTVARTTESLIDGIEDFLKTMAA